MIYPYVGDFLISPIPLQLSFNYCSHKCSYCFANLNNPKRTFDLKEFQAQMKGLNSRNDLQSTLLRHRYPVLISNLVDPFATSNYSVAVPVIEMLTNMGIPVAIQTRGGRGIKDVLSFLPPSVWYISIPMLDDSIRQTIEPAAPTIQSRLDLISELTEIGHKVVVGINPTVEDWLGSDYIKLLSVLTQKGVTGIWVAAMHFSTRQINTMPAVDKARLTDSILLKGLKNSRALQQPCYDYLDKVTSFAKHIGLETEGMYNGETSDFFSPYNDVYKNTFPSIHNFINWCHRNKNTNDPVYFSEFKEVLAGKFPKGLFNLSPYLMCMSQKMVKEYHYKMSYTKLLNIAWNDVRLKRNLERFWCFAVSVTYDGKEMHYRHDDEGNVIYHFNPTSFDEDFFIVD